MKVCNTCRLSKPAADFNKDSAKRDGLHGRCRDCHRASARKWAADNRERFHDRIRSWKSSHPEQVRATNNKSRRVRHEANPLAERIHTGTRRAHKAGSRVESFTASDLLAYWKANQIAADRCYYTGKPLGTDFHLDHMVPLARGGSHSVDNLVPCTPAANLAKGNNCLEEWRNDA